MIRRVLCRQHGTLDLPSTFVGFAGYVYRPGVGLGLNLGDAFRPVSTSFRVFDSTPAAAPETAGFGFEYQDKVVPCRSMCRAYFDDMDVEESYVGVSIAATAYKRSREKLNIASFPYDGA
jgi:hypothetical protein